MKPEHLSHTQISMLHRCGEQYRRRYVEGERIPPGLGLLRGKATHAANEVNLIHKLEHDVLLPVDEVKQVAADSFDAQAEGSAYVIDGDYAELPAQEALGQAKDEAVDLAGLHAEKVAPAIEPTAVEVRIEIPASDALPVAFISILDLIDGGTRVLDTKTTRKSPPKNMAEVSDQLTSQGLAFAARYGELPESLALDYLVRTAKTKKLSHVRLETQRTREDFGVFIHRANAARRMIEAEVFLPAPTDSWACTAKFCGYYSTCHFARRGSSRPTT